MADKEKESFIGRPRKYPDGVSKRESWQAWKDSILAQGRRFITTDLSIDTIHFLRRQRRADERIGQTLERLLSRQIKRKGEKNDE